MSTSGSERQSQGRRRQVLYGIIVFLSAAIVMVLEIAAGRLIAPYVGVSLYSWTSIIGVVLAGLSLGNWSGGRWADAGAGSREVGIALATAAVTTLSILLILTVLAPAIQSRPLGLLTASFLFALALFFAPAVCLGMVAPMLTTLALRLNPRSGRVVGRMHALAALGSILGTFVTGFLLIQYFGTRMVIVWSGVALLGLALPLLRRIPAVTVGFVLLVIAIMLGAGLQAGFRNPCDEESQYYCIRVVESDDAMAPAGARTLVLDHLIHGISFGQDATLLLAPYAHLMDELVRLRLGERADTARYFFAGGGAYSQPRAVKSAFPRSRVHVAELDPAVTDVASRRLFLDKTEMDIGHTDARLALSRASAGEYDAVIGDVFHDVALPFHLTTQEYAELVASRLSEGGIYVLNVVDVFPDPRLVKSIAKTLAEVFESVDIWLQYIPETRSRATYVLSAGNDLQDRERTPVLESRHGLARNWLRVTDAVFATGTPVASLPVLTDDFVPVERLVSPLLMATVGTR